MDKNLKINDVQITSFDKKLYTFIFEYETDGDGQKQKRKLKLSINDISRVYKRVKLIVSHRSLIEFRIDVINAVDLSPYKSVKEVLVHKCFKKAPQMHILQKLINKTVELSKIENSKHVYLCKLFLQFLFTN